MRKPATLAALIAMAGIAHAEAPAETGGPAPVTPPAPTTAAADGRVIYQPDFFAQYTPQTALDMVRRVPGFSIDGGSDRRGFSGTAGNVLIDGARPSAKSQGLEDILGRIPARQVVRVELIRNASTGEAAGQSVVVNVVRTGSAGSGRYEIDGERTDDNRLTPRGELSYNGRVGKLEYTLGVDRYMEVRPLAGDRILRDGQDNFTGYRIDDAPRSYREANGNGSISTPLLGGLFNLNASGGRRNFRALLDSTGFDTLSAPTGSFRLSSNERVRKREIGGDWERRYGDFTLKLVGLDTREWYANDERTISRNGAGVQTSVVSQLRRNATVESIGRASVGWTISEANRIEFGGEGALNTLEARTRLTIDSGAGPTAIALPAANVTVEEERFEGFVTWTWKPATRWTLESGVTVETSTISQTGDTTASRTLTYWKPSMQVSRQIGTRDQVRLKFLRDVSQLDFDDFASSATLADSTVAAGNPDLRPQSTWSLQGTIDKRFGANGALSLEVNRDWIEDAADLVPILDTASGEYFDAPGNIGEGDALHVRLTGTIPLDVLLRGAQLKTALRWSESEVTDPVTQRTRQLSDFADTKVELEFRQDIAPLKLAWGVNFEKRSQVQFFRVAELETFEEGPYLDLFVETSALPGMKVRGYVSNIFNSEFKRERRFSAPNRNSPVFFEEERERQMGRFIGIEVSGNF